MLQASGLARLSRELDGASIAKVGTSTPKAVARRRARLGSDGYGSYLRSSRGYAVEEGFDSFYPPPRLQLAAQHALSPVRLCTPGLEIDLPEGLLTPCEFEAELNRLLLPLRLQTIADTEAGRHLCHRTGVDPRALQRFYRHGAIMRAATEITVMRPQAEIGALARFCCDIIIDAIFRVHAKRPIR